LFLWLCYLGCEPFAALRDAVRSMADAADFYKAELERRRRSRQTP
jgi:hypothetical protein